MRSWCSPYMRLEIYGNLLVLGVSFNVGELQAKPLLGVGGSGKTPTSLMVNTRFIFN